MPINMPRRKPGITVSDEELKNKLRAAEETLRGVLIPGYDVDLVSSGVVKLLRISFDGKRLAVFLDYTGSDPSCVFCRFINVQLWARILREARYKLSELGFDDVIFYDWSTGAKLE